MFRYVCCVSVASRIYFHNNKKKNRKETFGLHLLGDEVATVGNFIGMVKSTGWAGPRLDQERRRTFASRMSVDEDQWMTSRQNLYSSRFCMKTFCLINQVKIVIRVYDSASKIKKADGWPNKKQCVEGKGYLTRRCKVVLPGDSLT